MDASDVNASTAVAATEGGRAARQDPGIAYDHVGDLHQEGEELADTAKRIRSHLRTAFPDLRASTRVRRHGIGASAICVSIAHCAQADLTHQEDAHRFKRLVATELDRFTRYEWWPNHGMRAAYFHGLVSIEPNLRQNAS